MAFADKPSSESIEKFTPKEENIIYLCKNIKNQFKEVEIHLYIYSNRTNWKLTTWLDSSQIFFANSFKNFFLSIAIENPQFYNFLIQIIYTYNKFNFLSMPKFIGNNNFLNDYQSCFSQNLRKVQISNFFSGFTFAQLKKILYFSSLTLSNKIKKKNVRKSPILAIAVEICKKRYDDSPSPTIQNKIRKKSSIMKKYYFNYEFIINEFDYLIQKGDSVYFISNNEKDINFLKNYSIEDYNNYCVNNKNLEKEDLNKEEFERDFMRIIKHKIKNYKSFAVYKKKNFFKDFVNLYNEEELENIIDLQNHIIIIGELENFNQITLLLKKYSSRPAILFSQNKITEDEWISIRKNKNSFYYLGSFSNIKHIEKLQIENCFKIIIMPISNKKKLFPDSDTIILARIIQDIYPNTKILMELANENNLKLLDNKPVYLSNKTNSYFNYHFWPNVIKGSVFYSSLFLSFFAKSLYDSSVIDFMKQILGFNNQTKIKEKNNSIFHTVDLSDEITRKFKNFGELMNAILTFYPSITVLGIIKYKKEKKSDLSNTNIKKRLSRRRLTDFSIPIDLKKEKKGSISVFPSFFNSFENINDSSLEYMITNPRITLEINEKDKLFLLGNFKDISQFKFNDISSVYSSCLMLPTNMSHSENSFENSGNSVESEDIIEIKKVPEFYNNVVKRKKIFSLSKITELFEKSKLIVEKIKGNNFKIGENFQIKLQTKDILVSLIKQKDDIYKKIKS